MINNNNIENFEEAFQHLLTYLCILIRNSMYTKSAHASIAINKHIVAGKKFKFIQYVSGSKDQWYRSNKEKQDA